MSGIRAGRRGVISGAGYVALCSGLAVLVARGTAPGWTTLALLVLLLPLAAAVFVLALNVVAATDGLLFSGWVGSLTFVVVVAVAAGLQAWMLRTIACNWHAAEPEVRLAPVQGGADTGA